MNAYSYRNNNFIIFFPPVLGDEQEYRLTRYLMANYDPSVRPAENASEPLKVVFGISLHHIIDVVSTYSTVTVCKLLEALVNRSTHNN